jgi:hypothetical protein
MANKEIELGFDISGDRVGWTVTTFLTDTTEAQWGSFVGEQLVAVVAWAQPYIQFLNN